MRLVRFPGSDLCACCGTHVTHTGEIGAVKILTVENFHEGIRLTMICGKRVMDYLNMVNDQNRQVSMKLSAKIGETAAAVTRLQDENFRLKGQVNHMFDELCTVEAKTGKVQEACFFSMRDWKLIRYAEWQMRLCRNAADAAPYFLQMEMEVTNMR